MLLCNWRRKRQAHQRLKRRAERKKHRLIKKRKKEMKSLKGLMVTKGLDQEGMTYQEMMTLMDEELEGSKKKAAAKRKQKALGMYIGTLPLVLCRHALQLTPLILSHYHPVQWCRLHHLIPLNRTLTILLVQEMM